MRRRRESFLEDSLARIGLSIGCADGLFKQMTITAPPGATFSPWIDWLVTFPYNTCKASTTQPQWWCNAAFDNNTTPSLTIMWPQQRRDAASNSHSSKRNKSLYVEDVCITFGLDLGSIHPYFEGNQGWSWGAWTTRKEILNWELRSLEMTTRFESTCSTTQFEGMQQWHGLKVRTQQHNLKVRTRRHNLKVHSRWHDLNVLSRQHNLKLRARGHNLKVRARQHNLKVRFSQHNLKERAQQHDLKVHARQHNMKVHAQWHDLKVRAWRHDLKVRAQRHYLKVRAQQHDWKICDQQHDLKVKVRAWQRGLLAMALIRPGSQRNC